jgi:hypothetical protein
MWSTHVMSTWYLQRPTNGPYLRSTFALNTPMTFCFSMRVGNTWLGTKWRTIARRIPQVAERARRLQSGDRNSTKFSGRLNIFFQNRGSPLGVARVAPLLTAVTPRRRLRIGWAAAGVLRTRLAGAERRRTGREGRFTCPVIEIFPDILMGIVKNL